MSSSIATEITTQDDWEAQPVGTLARVGFIEHDDNGNEADGGIMTILRVEGDITVTVGTYMLAGGSYWSGVWVWEQGADVIDTATILAEPEIPSEASPAADDAEHIVDSAIAGHKKRHDELMQIPARDYMAIHRADLPTASPATAIVEALRARGWTPPPA